MGIALARENGHWRNATNAALRERVELAAGRYDLPPHRELGLLDLADLWKEHRQELVSRVHSSEIEAVW